jgi:hypothetical protein
LSAICTLPRNVETTGSRQRSHDEVSELTRCFVGRVVGRARNFEAYRQCVRRPGGIDVLLRLGDAAYRIDKSDFESARGGRCKTADFDRTPAPSRTHLHHYLVIGTEGLPSASGPNLSTHGETEKARLKASCAA